MVERCVRDAEAASSNLVASIGALQQRSRSWPHGQAVKTTPSHGVNPGSIPGEVIRCFGTLCPKHLICQKKNGGQKEIFNFLCIQPYFLMIASVAQLVAQRIRNAWVAGSSPAGSLENTGVLRGKKVRKHQGLRTFSFFLGKSYIMAT